MKISLSDERAIEKPVIVCKILHLDKRCRLNPKILFYSMLIIFFGDISLGFSFGKVSERVPFSNLAFISSESICSPI